MTNLPWHNPERVEKFFALLDERILILDGAMGTMIQHHKLGEEDFRGERLADHGMPLQGDNDILNLTQPELIESIHKEFLEAGCDILETNTFNANDISQTDYGTEALTGEINRAGAEIARRAADAIEQEQPDRTCFVVGVLGPTNRTASISPDVSNPGYRNVDFDTLVETYREATAALLDGGVDLVMIETVFDTLNCKAAAFAVESVFADRGQRWPVWISGTITDASGRTLSGQTPEAFYYSVNHIDPAVVGFNCALGADQLKAHIGALAKVAQCRVSAHPNAGLPNEFGEYDETPEDMARVLKTYAEDGLVNIIGGCCGTTPNHLGAIGLAVADLKPRSLRNAKGERDER